jgi:hypothetical protein
MERLHRSFRPAGKRRREREAGTILIVVTVIMVVATGLAVSLLVLSGTEFKFADNLAVVHRAARLAEGANAKAETAVRSAISNYQTVPTGSTVTINGTSTTYTIATLYGQRTVTDAVGIQTMFQYYQVTGLATLGKTLGRSYKLVDIGRTPIFQYAVFYNNDLEIFPGPTMTLSGRVHTNRDLYIGSNATLTLDTNYVRSAGRMYRNRKDDGSHPTGSLSIKVNGSTSYANWASTLDSTTSTWVNDALTTWNGTVRSAEHDVSEVNVPQVPSIQPGGYFDTTAKLRIVDNQAFYNGVNVTSSLPANTITTKSFFDGREEKTVTTTVIDIGKLNTTTYFPPDGLIYAYRTDATVSQPNGIRLQNAATLKAALTVVSPDPVYIKGDYNTVSKKGASIITDAINLLSNNWNDTKTSAGTLPVASDSTYNVAMITGNHATNGAGYGYNGGLENLPRFHEDWAGKTSTIRGSFVNLWESQIAKGPWVYGANNYTAPNRDWDYDTSFNNISNLPPYTPMAVRTGKKIYWEWH